MTKSTKTNNEKIYDLSGKFRSEAGAAHYLEAYDKALELWPIPFETIYVRPRFGETHVIICGSQNAPPLILLPGFSFTSTMWYPNVASFANNYHVYALDTIVDMGKSPVQAPLCSRLQFMYWLQDIFDSLNINHPVVIGHSNGAWIALQLAITTPTFLNKLVLLTPPATFIQ